MKRQQISGLAGEYAAMGFRVRYYRPCGNMATEVSRWVFDMVKE
jgi:tRNA (guanine37-N1)-methyltransferase